MLPPPPEVADVWFDSGAMPFAQSHYPFNKKEKLAFPADYICEAVDQTRGWFYSMLNVGTLLGRGAPYKNVISLGHVLDAKGQKMSKSKGNVVNPQEMADKYGMDALRWYFFTVNAPGDEKRFEEKDIALHSRGFVATLWNSFVFFDTYTSKIKSPKFKVQSKNVLDQWILAKLNLLVAEVTTGLNEYDLVGAARAIDEFTINDFSQWYVRRSRRRFQHPETVQEKNEAAAVMARVLLTIAELSAPFTPFVSEAVYRGLRKKMGLKEESVYLRLWPKDKKTNAKSQKLLNDMEAARAIVSEALKLRASAGMKVRQPLQKLKIKNYKLQKQTELLELVKDEVNVKEIVFGDEMKLDTVLTPELKEEGMAREIIRNIQEMRREIGLTPQQATHMRIFFSTPRIEEMIKNRTSEIQKETRTHTAIRGDEFHSRLVRTVQFEDGDLKIEMA